MVPFMLLFSPIAAQTLEESRKVIESMKWTTEQYPPYNFVDGENDQLRGITVEILLKMFAKIGVGLSVDDIAVMPWPRGYRNLLEVPGTALFSTTYTVERLQLFRFVGPIIPTQVSVIAKKERNLGVLEVEELNQLTIGTISNDIGDQLIKQVGVTSEAIFEIGDPESMIKMLERGRLDAVAYAEDIAKYQIKLGGGDPNEYESVYVLQKSHMGYTFHKSTDPRVLEHLRKALDELRADGTVDKIYEKYFK